MSKKNFVCVVLVLLCTLPSALGRSQPAASGHWEGTITLPNKHLKVAVDLAQNDRGEWTGSLGLPELEISDFEFSKIEIKPESVLLDSITMPAEFSGTLSPDGETMKGGFICGWLRRVPVPMQLKRVAEPKLKAPAKSTPISKELEGTWEGTVKFGETWESDDPLAGSSAGFRVRLAEGSDGIATGGLTKLAEPKTEVPLSIITEKGSSLRFEIRSAGAVYIGGLRGQELVGQWRQFGAEPVDLTLRRRGTD